MKHALYIVGAPGSGKTTLVESLTAGWPRQEFDRPLAHLLYPEPGVVELGRRREGGFSGTDALSMTAITKAEPWVQDIFFPVEYFLAEGDRLAIDRMFTALVIGGWELVVGHLAPPPEVCAERRARRAAELAKDLQPESWVRGRETKVANLVERWAPNVVTLDGGPSTIPALVERSRVAAALIHGATHESVCGAEGGR